MISKETVKQKTQELAQQDWDVEGITARFRKLEKEGIPRKELNHAELLANKDQILDRVQKRAEEYNFIALKFRNLSSDVTWIPGLARRTWRPLPRPKVLKSVGWRRASASDWLQKSS